MYLVDSAYQQMKNKLSINDGELLLKFFVIFSRFERALKYGSYFLSQPYFRPDWKRFIQDIEPHFNHTASPVLRKAFQFLKENNPNRERLGEWGIESEPLREGDSDLQTVVFYLQGVRNNLFHGAKGEMGNFIRRSDRQYLESALILLNAFLELNKEVRSFFYDGLRLPESSMQESR